MKRYSSSDAKPGFMPPCDKGASEVRPSLPPLMVRGGVERSETEGIRRFENQIFLIKEGGRDLTNAKNNTNRKTE